jgi:hypothetical protein
VVDRPVDPHRALKSLVDVAVSSDDPGRLIAVAGNQLGHALGLVDDRGQALACVPADREGQRALAVARAAARTNAAAPPGWRTVQLAKHSAPLGFLAVGVNGPSDAETESLLGALPSLLADQLTRAALVRLHAAAFVRRLVSDPPLATHTARREAAHLGLRLAEAYWPAVLGWSPARAGVLQNVEREAQRLQNAGLTAVLGGDLVLLYPDSMYLEHGGPDAWFEAVAVIARALAPASQAQVIAGDSSVELGMLSAEVSALIELGRFAPRPQDERLVTSAHEYALEGLLWGAVAPDAAARFVEEQVGTLIEWDRRNRTDLACVLEAALDYPRHEEAARKCFMHRNTFRRSLRRATGVLGHRLDSPDSRLAVHLALKLRHRLTGRAIGADAGGPVPVRAPVEETARDNGAARK